MFGRSPCKSLSLLLFGALITYFSSPFLPVAHADGETIVISEIAWMGTTASSNDEWIELQNLTDSAIDITDWHLTWDGGDKEIILNGTIAAAGFWLLERTDDDSAPEVAADQIYTGALGNTGEHLILQNGSGATIFELDNSSSWAAGDNDTKQTMSRAADGTWTVSADPGGTPRAANFPDENEEPEEPEEPQEPAPEFPDDVTDLQVQSGDTQITLSWSLPASASGVILLRDQTAIDFAPQDGSGYDAATASQLIFSGSVVTFTDENLTNDTEYFYKIWTWNTALKYSTGATISATPFAIPDPPDITPPAEITDLQITPGDAQNTLSWTPPTDADFVSVRIVRGTEALQSCTEGDLVFEYSTDTSFVDQNLVNETEYFYRLCTFDDSGNYSSGVNVSATPWHTPAVIFSEVAWAGSSASSADEWLELRNLTDSEIDLGGWQIWDEVKNQVMITIPADVKIGTGALFLIANYDQTADNSTLAITPDLIENDISLSNSSLGITLRDSGGTILDWAGDGDDPPAGDSDDYKTSMQRASPPLFGKTAAAWTGALVTQNMKPAAPDCGTPGAANLTADTIAPAAITDLQVLQTSTGALLIFSPSFDDGDAGSAAQTVEIRFASAEITDENWDAAITLGAITGDHTTFFVPNAVLQNWFALRATDENGNASPVSNSAQLLVDETAPTLTISPTGENVVFATGALPMSISIISDDDFAQINCSGSGVDAVSFTGSGAVILNSDAEITCTAVDLAGNTAAEISSQFEFADMSGLVIFSELLPNPEGTDSGNEWIELQNTGTQNVALAGWTLTDGSRTFTFPAAAQIAAGGFYFLSSATSNISMQNSGDETFTLATPDDVAVSTVTRSSDAPSGYSYARDPETQSWSWTTTTTPARANIITKAAVGGGSSTTSSSLYTSAPRATQLDILITSVDFKNSEHDQVTFQCVNCSADGTDLAGWSVWDDGEIITIPRGFIVRTGETFTLSFKEQVATDLSQKLLRTDDSGLTATDEQVILKDAQGNIEDAVCWADRNGKWGAGEQNDVAELVALGHWKSSSGVDITESICVDSSQVGSNQMIVRRENADTDTLADWILQEENESEEKELEEEKLKTEEKSAPAVEEEIALPEQDWSSLIISELLPNPAGSDTENEWIELQNIGNVEINLTGAALRAGKSTFTFDGQVIAPGVFLLLPRPITKITLNNSAGDLQLLDPAGGIIDETMWGKSAEDESWSRFTNGWRWGTLTPAAPNQDLPTVENGKEEKSAAKKESTPAPQTAEDFYRDTDGDSIPDTFEQEIGSDPTQKEDGETISHNLTTYRQKLIAQVQVNSTLADPAPIAVKPRKLSGQATPFAKVHLEIHSRVIRTTVTADADGLWEYIPEEPLESGAHHVFAEVEDPRGIKTAKVEIAQFELADEWRPPVFAHEVRLSEILPNPAGKDEPATEWLEIENWSDRDIDLLGWEVTDGKSTHIFTGSVIVPARGFVQLFNSDLDLSFTNSRGQFALQNPIGRVIDSVSWSDALADDEALIFDPARNVWQVSLQATPAAANVLDQKNSAQNPDRISLAAIRFTEKGRWVRVAGQVMIAPDTLGRDAFWISDGEEFTRITSDKVSNLQAGDRVTVLGKISNPQDVGWQVLATADEAWVRVTDQGGIVDYTTKKPVPGEDLQLHHIYGIDGAVEDQERHFVTLQSGHTLSLAQFDSTPLLEKGDQITTRAIAQRDSRDPASLILVVWDPAQSTITIPENQLQDLLDKQLQITAATNQSRDFIPIFGGLVAGSGAAVWIRRKLREKCLVGCK